MKNYQNYGRQFFLPPVCKNSWIEKKYIEKAPVWCSVDLRDGNQALTVPMNLEEKIRFFEMLVKIGFKEIEIGFPAASETEFIFLRTLIERELIPDDVSVQVLTQSREHIIARTFEALKGAKNAIVHLYNSTSKAQREQVFRMEKEEIIKIAEEGARTVLKYAEKTEGNFRFEYSPESFSGTEPEFALEICNRVLDIWKPTADKKVIINLPNTVENSMPHVHASQIEYMSENLSYRDNVIISIHPHNDRGCAVAAAEMCLLAGAQRVEGTLFGNGERTGNLDIVTVAMNMYSQGVDPELDFSDIPAISEMYEETTHMHIYERQPYSGQLVFAAFSGSHQDAIAKGFKWREENKDSLWSVPYIPINPADIGREYQTDVIRINSQSGKGGIGYLLEQHYGYILPKKMREDFGYTVKAVSDRLHKELSHEEILNIFTETYVNIDTKLSLVEAHYTQRNGIEATVTIEYNGVKKVITRSGNGRMDAVSNALKESLGLDYNIVTYTEHALQQGSNSQAVAYVGIEEENGKITWGTGIHTDIMTASINALFSAVNRSEML